MNVVMLRTNLSGAGFDADTDTDFLTGHLHDVQVVDEPLEAVVLGAGVCLESYDLLKTMFMEAKV